MLFLCMGILGEKEKCNQFSQHKKKDTLAERDRGIKKGGVARKHGLSTSTQANFLQYRKSGGLILIQFDFRRKEVMLPTLKKWTELYADGF